MVFLSSTSLADASSCLKKYSYKWEDRLSSRPRDFRPVMRRGVWIHKCLEEFYKGNDWKAAITPMKGWGLARGVEQEQLDTIEAETVEIVEGYIDYWATRGGEWKTIGCEIPLQLKFGSHTLQATVDRIAENNLGLWIVEYKSTAHIPSAAWRSVDPQTGLQFFLAQQNGYDVQGIVFDYLVTSVPALPRWKKDGTLYANCAETTTKRFNQGVGAAVLLEGKGPTDVEADRQKLVNDGAFYQRYPVYRPKGAIQETMQDIVATLKDLEQAKRSGRYRRSFSVLTCPRFCSYSELCASEYSRGRIDQTLRDELYVIDDGSRGEGR